jgi:predicted nucleic acid-binding protein
LVSVSYWDTSCVIALYTPEEISNAVERLASAQKGPIHSSAILEFEMIFAIHAKESRREIPPGSSAKVLAKFTSDLAAGRFVLSPLGSDIKSCAQTVANAVHRSKEAVLLRTLDGIHISTAIQLRCSEFITADTRMAVAAELSGLKVRLPKNAKRL